MWHQQLKLLLMDLGKETNRLLNFASPTLAVFLRAIERLDITTFPENSNDLQFDKTDG